MRNIVMFVIFIMMLMPSAFSVQAADITITDVIGDVSSVDYLTQDITVVTSHPDIDVDNIDIVQATYTQQGTSATVTLQVKGIIENRGKLVDFDGQGIWDVTSISYDFTVITNLKKYMIGYCNNTGKLTYDNKEISLTSSDFSVIGETLSITFELVSADEIYKELSTSAAFYKWNFETIQVEYVYLLDIAPSPLNIMEVMVIPNTGSVGQTVQFNASVQPMTGQPPFQYRWDFGDGSTSTLLNPTHIYTKSGTYTYTFTVTDQAGDSASETDTIEISSTSISAEFFWTPTYPNAGQVISFNASASYPAVSIISYEWDWNNDGSYDESHTTPTVTHSWSQNGKYFVALRITDSDGKTDTSKTIITVGSGNQQPGINNKFVGKWDCLGDEGDRFYHELTFYSDGLVEVFHRTMSGGFSKSGTWECNESILTFNFVEDNLPRYYTYAFTNSETLILATNRGNLITYKKTIDTSSSPETPGFELVFVLCAISIAIILMSRKSKK